MQLTDEDISSKQKVTDHELLFSYSTMFKVTPLPSGGSQEIHNIKCAKLLTSTVFAVSCGYDTCFTVKAYDELYQLIKSMGLDFHILANTRFFLWVTATTVK